MRLSDVAVGQRVCYKIVGAARPEEFTVLAVGERRVFCRAVSDGLEGSFAPERLEPA